MPSISGNSSRRASSVSGFDVRDAAQLADCSYLPFSHSRTKNNVREVVNQDHVLAYMYDEDVLLIPGSNSVWDYGLYNLRPFRIGGKRYTLSSPETGEALGGFWHQGFLAHARVIHDTLGANKPRFIIGHSMGAASAQILSLLWGVPSVGFAAPRVYLGDATLPATPLSLSIYRADDIVGWLPGDRFRHAGTSVRLPIESGMPRHKMRHYHSVLKNPKYNRDVPSIWPAQQG